MIIQVMIRKLFIYQPSLILLCSNGGPSAPIEWVMDNIEYMTNENNRHKLMIGLNMYAMSYLPTRTPEPLVMKTVVEKLSVPRQDELYMEGDPVDENEELNWDGDSQEAWFVDYDEDGIKQGVVWMPTIRVRILKIYITNQNYISLLGTEYVLLKIMEVN